jgi:retinol dehydrogenase 12
MMRGKTVLVTGATDGIGMQTALELARMGASVIVHGRDQGRGERVVSIIQQASANPEVHFEKADFASLREVRSLADHIMAGYGRLDALINNAGVLMPHRQLTVDGIETTFAVNHLAHFVLTYFLLDMLRASAPSRIVTVSSITHLGARLALGDLQSETGNSGYWAYAHSKLCNVLFSMELAARLAGTGVTANSLHPGVIATKLLRAGFGSLPGQSLERGAETPVYLASAAEVAAVSGKYFVAKKIARHSPLADAPDARRQLWQVSQQLGGISWPAG